MFTLVVMESHFFFCAFTLCCTFVSRCFCLIKGEVRKYLIRYCVSEQLDHIEEGLDTINNEMKQAEQALKKMGKCCGACFLPWKRSANTNNCKLSYIKIFQKFRPGGGERWDVEIRGRRYGGLSSESSNVE